MKKKQKDKLKIKDVKELENLLSQARDSLSTLRLDKAQNKLKNPRGIFMKRKEIAYILTLIKEKQIEGEKNEKNI